jgi:hypothetical protein
MAIKKTLLEIVQSILSDMDSEDVNTISDTVEAQQIARVVEDTFYNIVATRDIPEHHGLLKLTPMSDSAYPTHFTYPVNVKAITGLWYDKSTTGTLEYGEVKWIEPELFLSRTDSRSSNYVSVLDKIAGTTLRIGNNQMPSFYTSFDDEYLVLDSYDSAIDTTLTAGKVRAMGSTVPVFSQTDAYVPDLDGVMFPYLLAESKSVCFSLFKGGPDPKIDQAARRQKSYVQNDMYRTKKENKRPKYGRH